MKISMRWIRALLDGAAVDGAKAADVLTRAGLEVEGIQKLGAFTGVVVAEVRGKKPHPDANKLTLVDVWDGKTTTQVVCGAPNVPEVGHKVLWARPGAQLPMGEGGAMVTLAAKAVRGIESPGMLCAEDELGLGASHAGIITIAPGDALQPGDDAAEKLGFPDEILELAVGPNRPDCLGHVGVARELAAGGVAPAPRPRSVGIDAMDGVVTIEIAEPARCSRYHATVLQGVHVGASPLDVQLRLAALGVRAISNVVDATNWVMLLHGQPTHAFDLDTLPGAKIRVRCAKAGEKLETLDGVVRDLLPTDLLICDGADRAIALAGVMGGKATEVTSKTTRVLLECAAFDPATVRATAKRLGLQSEASHRFERGVDPNGVAVVARTAAAWLMGHAGANVVAVHDHVERETTDKPLVLRAARTRTVTGLGDLSIERQAARLHALGLGVEMRGEEIDVTVPTFRPDLTREIDLIEEILRLEGYDKVPTTVPPLRAAPPELKHRLADRTRDLLNALGLDEAITYAFVAPRELSVFGLSPPHHLAMRIANPLREEQSALRTTLLPGILRATARNLAHGVADVRLFEVGHVFLAANLGKDGLPEERRHVAGVLVGRRDAWLKSGEPLDYFDLRGIVDELGRGLGHAFGVEASSAGWLHPGVQGALRIDDRVVGHLGELHPELATTFGIDPRVLVFEIDLAALPKVAQAALQPIPRYPAVERDVSFLVEARKSAAEIGKVIAAQAEPLLVGWAPREDYRDAAHVPDGQKSMLWSFTYRAADRTLMDAEVNAAHGRLLAALVKDAGASPR